MSAVHAFTDDALGADDAVALAARLVRREVSAAELTEAAIARCEAVDPALNGLAFDAYTRARRVSREPDDSGRFLAGIPTLVKDNVAVAGMPTQSGSDAFTAAPSAQSGDFFTMFDALGMVTIGKSQLSEFGFSAAAEHPRIGPVRNPWNTAHTSGASSAGAGAFVAAGVVPLAHGNDGGGSIRIPASACGLVGLKPTRDRLPSDRVMRAMPVRLTVNGALSRSVRDTAAFLREAERVHRNLKLPPIGDITGPAPGRLRVAFVTSSIGASGATVSAEVEDVTRQTAALLEDLGHHVTELPSPPVPDSFVEDFLLYWGFIAAEILAMGPIAFRGSWTPDKLDPLMVGTARRTRRRAHRLPGAIARLARSARHTERVYADYDVILTPTTATAPPLVGHLDPRLDYDVVLRRLLDWVAFTPLQNATGEPALSLPMGRSDQGLPIGMMFSAARGREAVLLELAYELEAARPFPRLGANGAPDPAR